MEEWKEYKLGDVCSRLRSGKGIKADSVFNTGKYPVIGGNGVRGYTDVSNFEGQAAVIGRQGAYCGNVRFFEGEAYMTEHAVVAVGNELAETRFLACFLSLMHLGNLSAQSAQPGISVQTLSKQLVRLPSISYQKSVSSIIKSLDDKIEVNKRINENLEQQAQALFKSWFVDFEPFKDQPFVDSELGMIPQGWKVVHLKDVCIKITDGVHNTVKDDENGKYLLLSCKNIKGGKITIGNNERRINEDTFLKLRKRTMIDKGDILLSSVGTLGEMVLLSESLEKIEFQRSVAIVKPNQDIVSPHFLYYSLLNQKNRIINAGHGAVQQCLFISDIAEFTTIIPPKEFIILFKKVVLQLTNQITLNNKESRRLAELRDTLLPRLMSGEIDVSEIKNNI
jgi:type I restriction enzyme S subunit